MYLTPFACRNCKSRVIDYVAEEGQYEATYFVCTHCGMVLEDDRIQSVVHDDELWDESTGLCQWDVATKKRPGYVGKKYFVRKLEALIKNKVPKDSKVIDALAFVHSRSFEVFKKVMPHRRKFIDLRCFVWFARSVIF